MERIPETLYPYIHGQHRNSLDEKGKPHAKTAARSLVLVEALGSNRSLDFTAMSRYVFRKALESKV
jgi:hypothetical protein